MSRSEVPVAPAVSVGEQLRTAREAAGVSAETFAREAHLTVRQVQALETDEYNWFNGPVFIKGYIRVYAKRFGLDGSALIAEFEGNNPEEAPRPLGSAMMRPQPLRSSYAPKFRQRTRFFRSRNLILLAIVLSLLALLAWLPQSTWFARSAATMAVVAAPEALLLDQPSAVEIGEAQMSLNTVVDNGLPVAADTFATTPLANRTEIAAEIAAMPVDSAAPAAAEDAALPAVLDETDAQQLMEEQERLLHLEFSDECWVQIKGKNGKVLHEKLHRAGDVVDLDIVPPVQLWFGRAGAVNVTYNGTAVALPVQPGAASVKFTFTDTQGQSVIE